MFWSSIFIFILNAVATRSDQEEKIKVVEWEVQKVYSPRGFDNREVAQFIIEGEFPSSCYRIKKIIVAPPDQDNRIFFQLLAYQYLEACDSNPTPFVRAVDVAILQPGVYTIWNTKIKEVAIGSIKIRETKSLTRDDFVYAPVDSSYTTWVPENQLSYITLAGTFSNSCQVFDRQNFWLMQTDTDLIEVLPNIKKESRADCRDGRYPFRERFWLSEEIPSGRYMIHIRTMDGESYNKTEFIKNIERKHK